MINITEYFESLGLLASLVTVITGYLTTHIPFLKTATGTVKQLLSWGVAIGISFIGQSLSIGLFVQASVFWTIMIGVAIGLVANGIFDIKIVQAILNFIRARKPSKV